MSSVIQLLPDLVINKIAAGEVVDRPASVLKELMENALDAGATSIEVTLVDGGRKLIQVADNGRGMNRDDALLCLERHATSKIREAEDLDRIGTFGFRGEALAAIAAVSRLTLVTRQADAANGTEVQISGGKILEVREAGSPVGTTMSIRNLFFNVPARRRFLRSDQTELAHLRQVFLLYAIAYESVALRLVIDEREAYRLAGGSTVTERLRELLGASALQALRPVDHAAEGVRVHGFVSLPHTTRGDRSEQFVFVNRRPASAPIVGFAISEAYQQLIPRGRHPVAVLFIELDPVEVDVNVHPTKKEVRFRNPGALRTALAEGLRAALQASAQPQGGDATPATAGLPNLRQLFSPSERPMSRPDTGQLEGVPAFPYPRIEPQQVSSTVPSSVVPVAQSDTVERKVPGTDSSPWAWFRVVGQVGGLYVVLETEDGLVVMDPQAAHERVLFERYMTEAATGTVATQGLLIPETVTLPPPRARAVRKHLEAFATLGLGLGEFGGDTFVVDALPACLGKASPSSLLNDLAESLETGLPRQTAPGWLREKMAQAACRSAVRAKDQLAVAEIDRLVRQLGACDMPYTCPHGRPTVIFMGYNELNRKFGRS